jgi:hypothetical protein
LVERKIGTPGKYVNDVVLTLRAGGVVKGRVIRPDGTPLSDATVVCCPAGSPPVPLREVLGSDGFIIDQLTKGTGINAT